MTVNRKGGFDRADSVWQDSAVAASYRKTRSGIPFADVHFDIVNQIIDAHGLDPSRVLDVGAGDGFATASLLAAHQIDEAVLVDFSQPMLDAAKRKFRGVTGSVTCAWADLQDSNWRTVAEVNGPFDLGISRFAIHHLSDARKRALYTEIFELLRPDGLFIQIEHVKSHSAVYERAFYTSLVDGVFRVESGARSRAEILASYVDSGERAANILVPVEDQLRWMRQSGFADVDCLFKAFELAVFAGRKPIPGSFLNA